MAEEVVPKRTFLSGVALPVFSWALPFHSLMVAVLFGGLGFSASSVRVFAAWKEAAVIGLVIYVIIRSISGRGPRVAISWIDIAVAGLLVIACGFFIGGHALFRIDMATSAELYGLRDIAFFLLLYFVGRASPEIVDDPNTLRRLYIIAVLTSAIAIVEWFLVTPQQLVLLGVASYFQEFLNVSAFTAGNVFGLPMNYWTHIGHVEVQRAGSVYLSSQGFAVPFLIIMPAATAWVLGAIKRRTLSVKIDYSIIWLGLLLSITRMTIIVCLLQLLVVIVLIRKPEWGVATLVACGVAFFLALVVLPGLPGFVWDTLTWQTSSSASHLNDWQRGLDAFFETPWGAGLATTDQSAVRAGIQPLTGDNGYMKYAVELGFQGLAAHLLIYLGIVLSAFQLYRFGSTPQRRLFGVVVFATSVGVMINAITAVVFNALTLSYLYFWFAGAAVTAAQRERRVAHAPALQPLELARA